VSRAGSLTRLDDVSEAPRMVKEGKRPAQKAEPVRDRNARPRVLVVDDYAPMLGHVARLLEKEFTVAGLVLDADSLLHGWPAARPDVIVMDISLPRCSGLEAAARVREAGCGVPIVFLTVHETPEIVRAAWDAGGLGYVAKRDLEWDLVPAIRAALHGQRFLSAAIDSQ
jgi:DNA-binding NarL/FixJ family response regulator